MNSAKLDDNRIKQFLVDFNDGNCMYELYFFHDGICVDILEISSEITRDRIITLLLDNDYSGVF